MAKPDLGTKRQCLNCTAKFYDLNRDPIVCPKCETVFVVPVTPVRQRAEPKVAPVPVAAAAPAVEPETTDAEFVSLEDAEAEQQGKKKPAKAGAAGEGEEPEGEEDNMDAFIEEEEGSADVSDIVGEGEKEEEA